MIKSSSVLLLLFILSFSAAAQNQFLVEGYVYQEDSQTPLPKVNIRISKEKRILTRDDGYFKILLNKGNYEFVLTHLGYDTLYYKVDVIKNINLQLLLKPSYTLITEVKVSGSKANNNVLNTSANTQTLSRKDIENVPGFLGQRDPIKAIQTLPGVGKGGEGNSGIYIRGGSSGQNLTLLNDAVIYNSSHLLGLFSVFNSGVADEVKLFKSGIPAQHGGRLSSLIEVNSSKEIADSLKIESDLSVFSGSANIIIPVNSNWSISTSLRKTFMNYTVWPLLNKLNLSSSFFNKMKYDFYDLNLTSNARLSAKDFLSFSAFSGGDDFGFGITRFNINNTMNWRNSALSLNWKRILSPQLVLNSSVTYSGYNFNFGMSQDQYMAGINSNIRDYSLKTYITAYLGKHQLMAGAHITDHKFRPNTPFAKSLDTELDYGTSNIYYADESSLFISDDMKLSDKIAIYAGSRLTYYRHKGPFIKVAEDNSETLYTRNKTISSYVFLEPSFTLRYALSTTSSVKLAYSKNVQPIHLISVTAVNFPADFWMPSVSNIAPERGYQTSLGYFRNFRDNKYETYIDVFYKNMRGLIEFSGGIINLLDNLKIEDNLYYGNGNAYGAEFYIKKVKGKITGWIGYTLSKSNRNFSQINEGVAFPFKYDRRHDLSLVSNYNVNSRWKVSAAFTFATGNTFTMPVSRYTIGGNIVNEYGPFNGSRMPAYHRLDLAASYKIRSSHRVQSEFSFSVYNLYNRQNPMYTYFMANGDLDKLRVSIEPKSVALLPVLPAINYKILFK